jgi:hypothetical protein
MRIGRPPVRWVSERVALQRQKNENKINVLKIRPVNSRAKATFRAWLAGPIPPGPDRARFEERNALIQKMKIAWHGMCM